MREESAGHLSVFDALTELVTRPVAFAVTTTRRLWTDAHMARQMLRFHLDPDTPLASRRPEEIEATADWLDDVVGIGGRRVCDLGCGPGLYAERFHDRGASVIGVDWSKVALDHARKSAASAGRHIDYRSLDYSNEPLPDGIDLFTLIYCDYCALAPPARRGLLARIRKALSPDGRFALDVHNAASFDAFESGLIIEPRLLDGFFAPGHYIGMKQSLRYDDALVTLDRYLIAEPHAEPWTLYNWLQYFSIDSLGRELASAGFEIEALVGSLAGGPLADEAPLLAAVARPSASAG